MKQGVPTMIAGLVIATIALTMFQSYFMGDTSDVVNAAEMGPIETVTE